MAIKLFVEKLNKEKTVGMTSNASMILQNVSHFKIPGIQHTEDMVGLVFVAEDM